MSKNCFYLKLCYSTVFCWLFHICRYICTQVGIRRYVHRIHMYAIFGWSIHRKMLWLSNKNFGYTIETTQASWPSSILLDGYSTDSTNASMKYWTRWWQNDMPPVHFSHFQWHAEQWVQLLLLVICSNHTPKMHHFWASGTTNRQTMLKAPYGRRGTNALKGTHVKPTST